mmetsp:Transcript_25126/g.74993  ORF Transcript_25126/g.74993 Transcript_25126/m.74993 type:complete len:462 (-) Transcript_25126:279-1664(-)
MELWQDCPLHAKFHGKRPTALGLAPGMSVPKPAASPASSPSKTSELNLTAATPAITEDFSKHTPSLLVKPGRVDGTPFESWLQERFDSMEARLSRRCDELESRLGVLTGAMFGDGSSLQQQISALKAGLESAERSWESSLTADRALAYSRIEELRVKLEVDVNASKVAVASLVDGLKVCGQSQECLESDVARLWRLVEVEHSGGVGKEKAMDSLMPRVQRIISKLEKTCTGLSGELQETLEEEMQEPSSGAAIFMDKPDASEEVKFALSTPLSPRLVRPDGSIATLAARQAGHAPGQSGSIEQGSRRQGSTRSAGAQSPPAPFRGGSPGADALTETSSARLPVHGSPPMRLRSVMSQQSVGMPAVPVSPKGGAQSPVPPHQAVAGLTNVSSKGLLTAGQFAQPGPPVLSGRHSSLPMSPRSDGAQLAGRAAGDRAPVSISKGYPVTVRPSVMIQAERMALI